MMKKFKLAALLMGCCVGSVQSKVSLINPDDNVKLEFAGKIGSGTNVDIWSNLLNHHVDEDKLIATKMAFDGVFNFITPTVKSVADIRTKAVFGNNKTIKVSSVTQKDPGGFLQPQDESHNHTLNLPAAWFREIWFEVDLTKALSMDAPFHSLTIGSFPFQVGRGIALGDVYAFNPGTLGFYTDGTVDQYAYGAKFTGGFVKHFEFSYDLYASVLQNNSTSLGETMAKTQGQSFEKTPDGARGSGRINWIGAVRLNITPIRNERTNLKIEPYVVHNYAPEQTVEFYADAESHLTTVGGAIQFNHGDWEFGCDGARNFGDQFVKGWDRMVVNRPNINGVATYVFSDIYTVNPNIVTPTIPADQLLYDPANTTVNNTIYSTPRTANSNGTQIAGTSYYNSLTRFRDPYENKYSGYMFVADCGYWAYKRDVKFAATAGIASGDVNPNANLQDPLASKVDGAYKGFIGLQEMYSGNLVKSVFVMGGSKKLVRPLSTPNSGSLYSSVVDTFSNLVFTGLSLNYCNKQTVAKVAINPNLLVYWEQMPGNKFDLLIGKTTDQQASKFLGIEFNVIAKGYLSENVIVDFMFALFQPGAHYIDVQGQPFTPAQRVRIDKWDPEDTPDILPVLWSDSAYSFATGLTYTF